MYCFLYSLLYWKGSAGRRNRGHRSCSGVVVKNANIDILEIVFYSKQCTRWERKMGGERDRGRMMARTDGNKPKSKTTTGLPAAPDVHDELEPVEAYASLRDAYGPYPLYALEDQESTLATSQSRERERELRVSPEEPTSEEWLRMQTRLLLREFLSVVPRSKEATTITFLRMDGTLQTLSRQELSAAIDRMRPRQRQIVRLAVEERWPQERVCAALKGISVRTVQRDLAEALDRLAEL